MMAQPLPTSTQAEDFFLKFRRMKEQGRREAGAAPPAAAGQRTINPQAVFTQVVQDAAPTPPALKNNRIVPMNLQEGTKEERLQKLKKSPTNTSPNLAESTVFSLLPMPTLRAGSRKTLVLDIDETLVHSSMTPKEHVRYDLQLPIQMNSETYQVHVKFRPHLFEFLDFVAQRFEVVIFTASVSNYGNALMDRLDPHGNLGALRLFREHCTQHRLPESKEVAYVKDLCRLGRDLSRTAIIDNSPNAYLYQQRNGIPISSFFDDEKDRALLDLLPLLDRLCKCVMVYDVLDDYNATGDPTYTGSTS